MAESQEFTRQQLLAMHKTQLIELAESLHIETEGLTKPQLIKQITGSRESVSADDREGDPQLNVGDVFRQVEAIHSPPKGVKVKSAELPSDTHMTEAQMNYTLELKRMEMQQMQMQMEERKHDREMQMQMQERENERQERLEMDRINLQLNRPIPQPRADAQPTFKVEVAAKLLPKLGADHELEVYLITFQKIAKLNNWPKEYWPAILQTQLKGKALRIFAELPDELSAFTNCVIRFLEVSTYYCVCSWCCWGTLVWLEEFFR